MSYNAYPNIRVVPNITGSTLGALGGTGCTDAISIVDLTKPSVADNTLRVNAFPERSSCRMHRVDWAKKPCELVHELPINLNGSLDWDT